MKAIRSVMLGAWILIAANFLMSLGTIAVFARMAPAIEVIIARNERSLKACEEMLVALVTTGRTISPQEDPQRQVFENALSRARGNVTEPGEPQAIAEISRNWKHAFDGDTVAVRRSLDAIVRLSEINREAMARADGKARQFGKAGAWAAVFMGTGVFLFGMLFLRNMQRTVFSPLNEIHAVVVAFLQGDRMRRCSAGVVAGDVRTVYQSINEILDRSST